jgi:predicted RNase H-like HicB family nuclease
MMRLTAAISEDSGWFVARCLEVEVVSQGKSLDEARRNLVEALELYFEDESEIVVNESPIIVPLDVAV